MAMKDEKLIQEWYEKNEPILKICSVCGERVFDEQIYNECTWCQEHVNLDDDGCHDEEYYGDARPWDRFD